MELVDKLTESLGVSQDQAQGGLGLILKLAKDKLGAGDFGKISELIPDSDSAIESAPESSGGVMGAIGGLAGSLGGKAADLGSLAGLADGFKSLDLDSGMIQKFGGVIIDFLKEKGGGAVSGILEGVFK